MQTYFIYLIINLTIYRLIILQESENIKCNINKLISNLLINFITKKLFYHNIDK